MLTFYSILGKKETKIYRGLKVHGGSNDGPDLKKV